MVESPPRLPWSRTWKVGPLGVEEEGADAPGFRRLSVYRIVGGPRDRRWRWCVTKDFVQIAQGYAPDRTAAIACAERAIDGAAASRPPAGGS